MKCSKCNRSTKMLLWIVPTIYEELLGTAKLQKIPLCKVHLKEAENRVNHPNQEIEARHAS